MDVLDAILEMTNFPMSDSSRFLLCNLTWQILPKSVKTTFCISLFGVQPNIDSSTPRTNIRYLFYYLFRWVCVSESAPSCLCRCVYVREYVWLRWCACLRVEGGVCACLFVFVRACVCIIYKKHSSLDWHMRTCTHAHTRTHAYARARTHTHNAFDRVNRRKLLLKLECRGVPTYVKSTHQWAHWTAYMCSLGFHSLRIIPNLKWSEARGYIIILTL